MKTKLESLTGSNLPASSRFSDTPETDALDDKLEDISPDEKSDYCLMRLHARKLEREKNALAKKFTRLDKPKYSGDPMLDSVLKDTNPDFRDWAHSLPPTYWARYDLSAARIGWEAACDEARGQLLAAKREAENLATSIYRAEYSNAAPNWELCDSVAGVISQIDNMYAGVRAQLDEARAQRDRLAATLKNCRDDLEMILLERLPNPSETWCSLCDADEALQSLTPNSQDH